MDNGVALSLEKPKSHKAKASNNDPQVLQYVRQLCEFVYLLLVELVESTREEDKSVCLTAKVPKPGQRNTREFDWVGPFLKKQREELEGELGKITLPLDQQSWSLSRITAKVLADNCNNFLNSPESTAKALRIKKECRIAEGVDPFDAFEFYSLSEPVTLLSRC